MKSCHRAIHLCHSELRRPGSPDWGHSNCKARFLCATIGIFEHDQIRRRSSATYCPFRHINLDSSFLTDRSDELLLILLFFFISLCIIFLNFSLNFRLKIDWCKFLWKFFFIICLENFLKNCQNSFKKSFNRFLIGWYVQPK